MTRLNKQEPSQGYEIRDIPAGMIALIAGGLFLAVLLVMALTAVVEGLLGKPDRAAGVTPPVAIPKPQLQTAPSKDLQDYLNKEDAELWSYGWVDRSRGIARLPIARAMELIVKRGIPEMPQPLTPQDIRLNKAKQATETGHGQ